MVTPANPLVLDEIIFQKRLGNSKINFVQRLQELIEHERNRPLESANNGVLHNVYLQFLLDSATFPSRSRTDMLYQKLVTYQGDPTQKAERASHGNSKKFVEDLGAFLRAYQALCNEY